MDYLSEFFDFDDGLDGWTRYGLLVINFLTIGFIFIAKVIKKQKQPSADSADSPKTILFIIAHPDDESMFFLPTIKEMKRQDYILHLLCFSNGDFDGLGKTREKELEKASKFLGFDRLEIINDDQIQDGMRSIWPVEKMSEIINSYVQTHKVSGIFTFDEKGISGHPNHIDVYRSVRLFKKNKADKEFKFFQLQTVNIFRKYIGFFDIMFSILADYTFLNYNVLSAWKAMAIHHSQFVYYRKAFVIFSRYAYINTIEPLE